MLGALNQTGGDYSACQQNLQNQNQLKAQLQIIQDENTELKKQIDFKNSSKLPVVTAQIIGKEINNSGQVIVLNRGSRDGIKINQPAIEGEGVVVGKIIKTEADISFVRLITDNATKLAAVILNRDRSQGVVEGGYGISLRMTLIPRNEVVMVGDQVITSGLEEGIPRGLLIGTVAVVENEAYKPFQQAILTPNANIDKLTLLGVLLLN